MREESQNRAEVALSAARTRLAPPLFGLLAGVAAGAAMPRTTEGTGYFGVVVQVLPVLLLALAIEARAFSSRARVDADEGTEGPRFDAGTMEMARQVLLNPATVVVLIAAEIEGFVRLSGDDSGTHQIWLQNAALVWGFTTVAALALIGQGAPRLIATLESRLYDDSSIVVEVGASNEYGDKDISPVMNFLVPDFISIHVCDVNGNLDAARSAALTGPPHRRGDRRHQRLELPKWTSSGLGWRRDRRVPAARRPGQGPHLSTGAAIRPHRATQRTRSRPSRSQNAQRHRLQ